MKRKLVRLLTGLALAGLLAGGLSAQAAPPPSPSGGLYIVNRTDDPVRAPGFGCRLLTDGGCSLRDAVLAANTHAGLDTIELAYGAQYNLSDAASGSLDLTDSVNFGFSNTCNNIFLFCLATIHGGPSWHARLISIEAGVTVQMDSIWLEEGHSPVYGGGIQLLMGSVLTLTNSFVYSNTAVSGGGLYSQGSLYLIDTWVTYNTATQNGGGLAVDANSPGLVIDQSTIDHNHAAGWGGGIYDTTLSHLSRTTISNNTISADSGSGGGLYYAGTPTAELNTMTIVSNTAAGDTSVGGGIGVHGAPLDLVNSILGWNRASGATDCGGGLGADGASHVTVANSTLQYNQATFGGGACVDGGFVTAVLTMTNSTVYGNQAVRDGGGLNFVYGNLYNVTVSQNVADSHNAGPGDGGGVYVSAAGQLNLANSILAGNVDLGGEPPECNGSGGIHSLGYNIIQGANACALGGTLTGNKIGNNPLLGPLADHGGPTWTQALSGSSPAVNNGNPAGCRDGLGTLLTKDQRGQPRWLHCDIGAFEFQPYRLFLPLVWR